MSVTKNRKPPAADLPAGAWPEALPDDVPTQTKLAAAVARRLDDTRRQMSYREVQHITGISHQTISNIIRGLTWPDLHTIATLETQLETQLWGTEHLPERIKRKLKKRR